GFVDQPFDHVPFVVQRELDGDWRQSLEALGRLALGLPAVLEIGVNDVVAVDAVYRKDNQDSEIRNQHCPIEPIELMNSRERVVHDATDQSFGTAWACDQKSQNGGKRHANA